MITLGNERLHESTYADLIGGRRVGLITNHSGVDHNLRSTADRLHACDACELVALFGPEHGVRGDAADGDRIASGRDPYTGVPACSLYGDRLQPSTGMLEKLDVMLFDIQDVGARFYTYLYTMSLSMQACGAHDIPFVVLDRPNPLGGVRVAGNVLDPAFASFVGLHPISICHGLTIGELAVLFNHEYGLGADLSVVPMRGWNRSMQWEQTGLPWVAPSPNMPTMDTATVYPGTCLIEGTNLSEGRGTAKPFEQLGAPYVDGPRLAAELGDLALPGVLFRPLYFQPAFSKYAGDVCRGVQLHVVDRSVFEPVRTGLEVIAAVRRLWPAEFGWRTTSDDIYNFDRLAGTDRIRRQIDAGVPVASIQADWADELARFVRLRQSYLSYP